jgi:hypothetical protein
MVGIVGTAFSIIAVCAVAIECPSGSSGVRSGCLLVDCARGVGKPTSASPSLK